VTSAKLPLEVSTATRGSWRVATVSGDLDMATAPHLEKSCANGDGQLALDMSGVRFIDSSGLRALFEINKASSRFVLVGSSGVVKRLLSLTEMTDVFEMSDDLNDLDS